jgi:ABC-type branched-subunit amino acid transport system substrate-binding protein/TolA-binding protein
MSNRMRELVVICSIALCACPRASTGQGTEETRPVDVKPSAEADNALKDADAVASSKSRKEAIEALLSVRKRFPDTTAGQTALYKAGMLSYEEGDYAGARKSLSELLFDNPLYPDANKARLTSGLAALELKAWRDAYQTLSSLVDKLEGPDKVRAEEALAKAAAGSQQFGEALKMALRKVDDASGEDKKAALSQLQDVVETKSNFLALAEAWHELPTSHPAWPMMTFKLARVYYHLRDWTRLDETLRALLKNAPDSPWAPEAKELLSRVSRRATVKPKTIGAVLPLSGKYKAFGDAALRGLQLALKGSDVELVVKDTQGDPALTGKLVEQLAFDEGVIGILGPLLSDDSRRAALVAEELQVPIITLSRADGLTQIGPNVFRTMVTNAQQADALVDYAMGTLGYKTFAVLHPNTPFGVELTNAFWDAVEKRGGQIRGVESYDHDQKTFTEEAKKLVGRYYLEDRSDYYDKVREIREKDLDELHRRRALEKMRGALDPVVDFEGLLIPDSWQMVSLVAPALAVEDLITNACDKKDIERIQKTTGKDKMKTVTLLGPSTWSSPKGASGDPMLIERGGKYVQCAVYVDSFYEGSDRAATRSFVQAFRETHHDATITLLDAVAYDTASLVKTIVDKHAPTTRAAFRDQLQALKNFQGATGSISFGDDREAERQLFLLNITPKGIKEVTPVSRKPEG